MKNFVKFIIISFVILLVGSISVVLLKHYTNLDNTVFDIIRSLEIFYSGYWFAVLCRSKPVLMK
jgi:hypothetical protein